MGGKTDVAPGSCWSFLADPWALGLEGEGPEGVPHGACPERS